ncbi:MAG TPA: hypothetical protein VFR95_00630 [Gemmatimonadaceae bacterium]|nr:hypothetical protein [Gemmatimonadaceae bacterium]
MTVHERDSRAARRAEWLLALGTHWRAILALYVATAFVLAALMPLDDIDFPMHLAIGEWIARHHSVPFTEPFAWTRVGAPYFAYSWLVQLGSYGLLSIFGPLGPHLLYGAIGAAAVLAIAAMGRAEGWRPWPTLILAAIHFVVLTRVTPSLRPQVVLYALVPFAWAAATALRRGDERSTRWALAALFIVSALAANSHILFALTGAPVFVLLVDPPARRRTVLLAVAVVIAGWLFSPYGLSWPEVFRLNFAPNPLFRYPSPISEYQPGFNAAPLIGIFLALVPWFAAGSPFFRAEGTLASPAVRRWFALAAIWLVGLMAFSRVEKAVTIWWLVSLPLAGATLSRIPDPRSLLRARIRIGALALIGLLLCAEHLLMGSATRSREGSVESRTLPGRWAVAAEPLASWLQSNARPTNRARLFTTFNFGSYLTWRLPAYSASIDSRTIFPDSVALPEAYIVKNLADTSLGPWRSADVAIVPLDYAVASAIDRSPEWVRLARPDSANAKRALLGLWARRAWWDSVRVAQ